MVGFSPRSDWVDLPSTSTPVFAADLLRYENGIANLDAHFLPCDLATTAAITLSGTGQTIDGFTVTAGMRIFNKDDATATNRGIYIAGAGTWARSSDMANLATFRSGSTVAIRAGSSNGGTIWSVAKSGSTTGQIGTDSLTITALTKRIQNNGTGVTIRPGLNFTGTGVTVADNSGSNRTDVTVPGMGGIAYQTVTVNGSNVFGITSAGAWSCTVTSDGAVIGIQDIPTDVGAQVFLRVQQDATGGHRWNISPSTVVWDSGQGPAVNAPGNAAGYNSWTAPYDTSANSVTYIELLWMGSSVGWYGKVTGFIPQLYYTPSSTMNWTIAPAGDVTPYAGGATTQPINVNITFMRNVTSLMQGWYFNALLQTFSAATRLRMTNGNWVIEACANYCEDGPQGNGYRGSFENSADGFNVQLGTTCLCVVSGMDKVKAMGVMRHEACHSLSYTYYSAFGGSNPAPGPSVGNGSEPRTIEQHSTLVALRNDCVTDAVPGSPPAGTAEWFAEMERGRRVGDNCGTGTFTAPQSGSSVYNQLGNGTTTGTQASRANRFSTYMLSLSLE